MADVWLFPYLCLEKRQRVHRWRLIPRRRLRKQDAVAPWLFPLMRRLGEMYESPDTRRDRLNAGRFGCFVAAQGGRLGDTHDSDEMASLRLAVTAGLLDGNPKVKDKNATAHTVSTSDNATLYGHRVTPDAHVAAEYGVMARTLVGGYTIGEKGGEFRQPAELHLPLFGTAFDAEYASVIYRLLRKGDALAIRLGRAIEWLDLTWKNTASIPPDIRVVAIRSGFEVLLGVGDDTFQVAEALSRLLDPPGATRRRRSWTARSGKPKEQDMTDLQWWFVVFSFLRNDITHGKAIVPAAYRFNGESHVMIGERNLRRAIKATVLPYGHKWLALEPADRKLKRAVAAAVRSVKRKQSETGEV